MNDYEFGNYIYDMRKKAKLTQAQLAEKLGVQNKSVSKWENGVSKPDVNRLKLLSDIFGVPVEELLKMKQKKETKITKIVVTGGPCAGKTTAMSWIQKEFTEKGYDVLFVSEGATELILGGVSPRTCETPNDFQECLIELQLAKEKVYERAARVMKKDKVLIVCDRGILDNKAYMKPLDFEQSLKKINTNEVVQRDSYDAVFHLVSAAKGAEDAYTFEGNKARHESKEEAAILDDKVIAAWTGHPHFRVIDNSTDFEGKLRRLIAEISAFLGEPEPCEIERKFLIEYPDIQWLEHLPNCQRVEIVQRYLKSDNDDEVRVRQRGYDGNYIYIKTTKRKINNMKRVEVEERLTQEEYLKCLMDVDDRRKQICKTRYCLTYENQYFEIDTYPFWDDKAILEIELREETQDIIFPKEIKVIEEVTDDIAYKNATLALRN